MPEFTTPNAALTEVNRCHGKGRGHPCTPGAPLQMKHTLEGGYVHKLAFKRGRTEVGHIEYTMNRYGGAEIEYVGVKKALRGQGIGEEIYRAFAKDVAKRGATYILGEVTSQGVLRLRNKVLGKPAGIFTAVDEYTLDEAMAALPPRSPENVEGIIDTADHIAVRHLIPDWAKP